MPILHIEHEISDLTTWLEAFNRFAPAREQADVQQTEVFQPSDDPNYIVVSLRFESVDRQAISALRKRDLVVAGGLATLAGITARMRTEVSL